MKAKLLPIRPMASQRMNEGQTKVHELMQPIFEALDKYDIPPEKHKTVIGFTVEYYSRNKQMKHPRIVRKVVETFHLSPK
jgi:hypothetical protein